MRRDWKRMLYMLPAGFAAAMVFAIGAFAARTVYADSIPTADTIYNAENDWEGTLTLNHNCTVKIIDVTHSNEGTGNAAAIKIIDGAVVNLVFEGTNVLTANSGIEGAGIEV